MNTVDENIAALVARYRTPDACLGARQVSGDTAMTVLIRSLTPLAHPAYRTLPRGRIESMHAVHFLVDEE